MKYTQDYRYQNISGGGRNCDDRWDIISKYIKGNQNTLSIDVGSAEGVFSKRIVEKTGGKVISIEGSDFVYNEQLNYCSDEINSHNIQLHKIALNRDNINQFLNNDYDYTLLMSVLHWCDEPDIILKSLSDKSEYIFVELPDLNDSKSYGQEYLQRIKRDFGNIENYLQEITEKPIVGAYKVEGNNSEYRVVYVLKNTPNVELVDIDDIFHLIHGDEEKVEYSYISGSFKAVRISKSPVVSYINGDLETYRSQPKLFYRREDTIDYLLNEYESGDRDWLMKAVWYKGRYVISDGMHRSSVLYTKGYRKVFVEIVSGASEKTATFERFLKDENFVNPDVDNYVDNPINDGHYLELMDRTHVACCMVSDHLVEHPLSIADVEIRTILEEALNKLAEAYQIIGSKTP
jgi:hypothetical protein